MNRTQGNDAKRHYKMFKSGKHWAFMAITTFTVTGGLAFAQSYTTHAAENDSKVPAAALTTTATPQTSDSDTATALSEEQAQTATADTNEETTTETATSTPAQATASETQPDTADSSNTADATPATSTTTQTATNDAQANTSASSDTTSATASSEKSTQTTATDATSTPAGDPAGDDDTTSIDPALKDPKLLAIKAKVFAASTNGKAQSSYFKGTGDYQAAQDAASHQDENSDKFVAPDLTGNTYFEYTVASNDTATLLPPKGDTYELQKRQIMELPNQAQLL